MRLQENSLIGCQTQAIAYSLPPTQVRALIRLDLLRAGRNGTLLVGGSFTLVVFYLRLTS